MTFAPSLLPLFMVVPLCAAAVCVVFRGPVVSRILLIGVPAAMAGAGVWLIGVHRSTPYLAHAVGGFDPAVSISLLSDMASAVMLTVAGVALTISAVHLVLTGEDRLHFVPSLVLMASAGVAGAFLTADLFNLFVWIEVMLLPSYGLIAVTGVWSRLQAGRTFLLVNVLTSTLLLMGIGLVYGVTGTVNLGALGGTAAHDARTAFAVALVLLALCVKAAVVPVHGWLPRTYPAASAGIMSVFAAIHTKVALYAIYRVYAVTYDGAPAAWAPFLTVVVVVTMLVGAVATFGERRMRTSLSWQMVSGVGHILIGPLVLTSAALGVGLFYLAHHVFTMGALILVAGAIERTYGTGRFDRLSGLMRREPWAAVVMALGMASLVGLPPMSGLWGKVGLVTAISDAAGMGEWVLFAAIVLSSVVTLMAMQRFWGQVMWGPPMEKYRPDHLTTGQGGLVDLPEDLRIPRALMVPATVFLVLSVAMFLVPGPIIDVVETAGVRLLDVDGYRAAVLP